MSHHIHTTEGVVIGRYPYEEDAFFLVFTKDLGLVRCYAQGVRKISSKLKFGLQEYTLTEISFVKGKGGWRITSSLPKKNLYYDSAHQKNIEVLAKISKSIGRLVQGEERNENLYNSFLYGLEKSRDSTEENAKYFETLTMFRIMYFLGYIDKSNYPDFIFEPQNVSDVVLRFVKDKNPEMIYLVNKGLKESHL